MSLRYPAGWRRDLLLVVMLLVVVGSCAVAATVRDPFDAPTHLLGLYLGASLVGGMVRWYGRVKGGSHRSKSILILLGDMLTAAFAGLLVYLLCTWSDASPAVTGVFVGLAGHMGARAIALLEQWGERALRRAGIQIPPMTGQAPFDDEPIDRKDKL